MFGVSQEVMFIIAFVELLVIDSASAPSAFNEVLLSVNEDDVPRVICFAVPIELISESVACSSASP